MRDMTHGEIMDFISYWTWGTLIGVERSRPYAVELSYGTDGDFLYCGSMPGGRMARCVRSNPEVAFKICECGRNYARYRAVLIEGRAELLTAAEDIRYAVRRIALQAGLPESAFDGIVQRVAGHPESNSVKIPLSRVSGKSAGY
jgi:nitroimidazol reductase NimA-like FMN-containing flavoprotein (pyridoxamine 5'-phosphate oxidase superfamily)